MVQNTCRSRWSIEVISRVFLELGTGYEAHRSAGIYTEIDIKIPY